MQSFPPVVISNSATIELTSRLNGLRYTLLVSIPKVDAPADGFPVLYVLDGSAYHGITTDLVRMRTSNMGSEIRAPLIVSIAHPEAFGSPLDWLRRRFIDFTPTVAAEPNWFTGEVYTAATAGQLDVFLDVLEQEIKPMISQHFDASSEGGALIGHSLGGLAVLHALFKRPTSFKTFIASSPSIWYDGQSVLSGEQAFSAQVTTHEVSPKVYIGVGEYEQDVVTKLVGAQMPSGKVLTHDMLAAEMTRCRMIGNAADLATRLAALPGAEGYSVKFDVFPGESHGTAIAAALRPALDIAFPF